MRVVLLIVACLAALRPPASGQTVFSRPYQPNQIALEAFVPELPNDDASGRSGATFLTVTRSLSENIELTAELPVARYAADDSSTAAVGNPYVGVGLSSTSAPSSRRTGALVLLSPTPT